MHCCFGLYVPEIWTANVRRMLMPPTPLAMKREPADNDTQICHLSPSLIWICNFSWVVDCGSTRPRGWLLSMLLSQMCPIVQERRHISRSHIHTRARAHLKIPLPLKCLIFYIVKFLRIFFLWWCRNLTKEMGNTDSSKHLLISLNIYISKEGSRYSRSY